MHLCPRKKSSASQSYLMILIFLISFFFNSDKLIKYQSIDRILSRAPNQKLKFFKSFIVNKKKQICEKWFRLILDLSLSFYEYLYISLLIYIIWLLMYVLICFLHFFHYYFLRWVCLLFLSLWLLSNKKSRQNIKVEAVQWTISQSVC